MAAVVRKSIPLATFAIIAGLMTAAAPVSAFNIGSILNNHPSDAGFKIVTVAQLQKMLAKPDSHLHLYDANPWGVRESEGMIPGARPLTSADDYSVASELPSDKSAPLIFYCHNFH